ncbi:ERF family protein [Shimia sp. MIT910701]|uniref:ERF family protein n=1 Tax=Shimia sp. MIT910701 TaxID=3096987 RepID=UPI00399C122E
MTSSILSKSDRRPAPNMGPLYAALAKAQGEFPEIPKNKTGHGYKYADIADILRAVRPILSKNGLSIFQSIAGDKLETTLAHETGATLVSRYPLVQDGTGRMNNIQKIGAALTYARRYSLTALLGVAADEDVDADDLSVTGRNEGRAISNGLKDAWIDGVLDNLPDDATDAEKADAFASQIIADMRGMKTAKGVNNVWNKREQIIEALDKKHNHLFQDVFDCFQSCMASYEAEAA